MASKSATLSIKIVSDAKAAGAGFREAEDRVGGFQRGLDRASVASAGVLAGLAAVGAAAYEAASDLQQSTGAVESVFGAQADAVRELAEAAAQTVGLSTNSYNELAAVVGSQFGNMGIAQDQLAGSTDELIRLGADLAATYGGTTADAVGALSSLMRGETDPIERYGVSIKQADIAARLAAEGLDDLEGPAAKAAQTQALLGLLSDQTGASLGAFARESGTAAGQTQRASAEFENAKAALGEALLPIVSAAAEKFAELATFVAENSDTFQTIAVVMGTVAAAVLAINTALKVYRAITTVVTAVQWLFNSALMANPLFWIAAIIVGIIAVVVLLYNKFEPVRTALQAIGGFFADAFGAAIDAIQPVVDIVQWLWDLLGDALGLIGDAAAWVGDLFGGASGGGGGGGTAGVYGAARTGGGGTYAAAPAIRGASMGTLSGGPGPAAGQGQIVINVNGALDPVAVGRQLVSILREYGVATGSQVAIQLGGRA